MKTKLDRGDREEVIKMVLGNRADFEESIVARHLLGTCPFDMECFVCDRIFPKWGHVRRGAHKCPCGSMGVSYVKRRMKKLFPELY